MRQDPISAFLVFMSGHNPDQMHLGEVVRLYTAVLYWVLLISSMAIAYWNLREEPTQRTVGHVSIFLMRVLAAGMWYLETLWKLPGSVTPGFRFWMDQTVKFDAYGLHANLLQILADHIAVVQPVIYVLELLIAASLMLGFFVPVWSAIATLYTINLFLGLYNDPAEWPWTYVGLICAHGMFAVTRAGRSLGTDAIIARVTGSHVMRRELIARILRYVS
jgi:uncharacterized membrane protein YphA (DoxX/SURF4 family)